MLQLLMLKCKYTFINLGVNEYFLLLCPVYVKGGLFQNSSCFKKGSAALSVGLLFPVFAKE